MKKAAAAANTYWKKPDMKKEREKRCKAENRSRDEPRQPRWEFHDLRLRFDLPFYIETCEKDMKPFAYENA